jgi:hypothetical protein
MGANPNLCGNNGETPLLIAARKRFDSAIILLCKSGATRDYMTTHFFRECTYMDEAAKSKFKKDYNYITELKEDLNLSR